jgi:hypothetical protein
MKREGEKTVENREFGVFRHYVKLHTSDNVITFDFIDLKDLLA